MCNNINIARGNCTQYSTSREYTKEVKKFNIQRVCTTREYNLGHDGKCKQEANWTNLTSVSTLYYQKAHLFFIFVLVLLYFWHSRSLLVRYQSQYTRRRLVLGFRGEVAFNVSSKKSIKAKFERFWRPPIGIRYHRRHLSTAEGFVKSSRSLVISAWSTHA